MAMHYRLGWPFGMAFARLGLPVLIRVNVIRDEEAGVYVGTSSDVRGLVVEAESFEDLVKESKLVIKDLLEVQSGHIPRHMDRVDVSTRLLACT